MHFTRKPRLSLYKKILKILAMSFFALDLLSCKSSEKASTVKDLQHHRGDIRDARMIYQDFDKNNNSVVILKRCPDNYKFTKTPADRNCNHICEKIEPADFYNKRLPKEKADKYMALIRDSNLFISDTDFPEGLSWVEAVKPFGTKCTQEEANELQEFRSGLEKLFSTRSCPIGTLQFPGIYCEMFNMEECYGVIDKLRTEIGHKTLHIEHLVTLDKKSYFAGSTEFIPITGDLIWFGQREYARNCTFDNVSKHPEKEDPREEQLRREIEERRRATTEGRLQSEKRIRCRERQVNCLNAIPENSGSIMFDLVRECQIEFDTCMSSQY